jgi:hypothetical protein
VNSAGMSSRPTGSNLSSSRWSLVGIANKAEI